MNQEILEQMAPDKGDAQAIATRPFLISFSGIDGAGKTTQIEHVSACLQKQGLRVLRLSFWDDVAVWSKMRAGAGLAVTSRPADPTAQHSFSPKNNKHVRKWYLTAARAGFYMLDVARLHRLLASQRIRNSDVIIFDRYIYDQIANIYSPSLAGLRYAKLLLKQTPTPDLAFILDASPAAAFERKPEYPLEFMYQNRRAFLLLAQLVPQLIVISQAREEDVKSDIATHISRSRLVVGISPEENTEVTRDSAVVRLQTSCRVRSDPTARL